MIDRTRIAELKANFGPEGFAEVVEIFEEETAPVVDRLHHGHSNNPAADLHFVKGSADNMGLTELATICRRAEAALVGGGAPDLAGLRAAYDRGRAELLHPVA